MKDRNCRNGEPGLIHNARALGGLNHLDWLSFKHEPTPSRPQGDQGNLVTSKQCPPRPLEPWEGEETACPWGLNSNPPPWWNMGSALRCRLVWTWVHNGYECVRFSLCACVFRRSSEFATQQSYEIYVNNDVLMTYHRITRRKAFHWSFAHFEIIRMTNVRHCEVKKNVNFHIIW